ncbi:uncharacterized protein LOC130128413 [Lampris incognitus]|uniref:uncharacterized protein LOC130128413 n=1 Tax=Lampris incognitus TaxID=2546036 RepID=UPI0024B566C1|nr:uncharacterized protein LOC130128413 [Lampris incognitus]
MTSSTGTAPLPVVLGLSLDTGGLWHQKAMQRSRTLVQTYLFSRPGPLPPNASGTRPTKDPLRLPFLATAHGPHQQTIPAPLSFSEPPFFTLGERAMFKGFSRNRRPSSLRRRLPSMSPLTCDLSEKSYAHISLQQHHHQAQSCMRPVYAHFSQPIQFSNKSSPVKPAAASHSLTWSPKGAHEDLQPLVMQYRYCPSQGETLSVIGRPCLPSSAQPSAPPPPRTQLHVFLPTEGLRGGGEADSESVDEGFMDEPDCKVTSLKIQQGTPKTPMYH